MLFRYSRWDGSQDLAPFDADELVDALSDDLIAGRDLSSALQRLLRQGWTDRAGRQVGGVDELLDRLRRQRRAELERYDMGSIMDDLRRRLDEIVVKERGAIARRLADAQQSGTDGQEKANAALLRRIANKKQRYLDALPGDVGGAVKALSDYEFIDDVARQEFQDLLRELERQIVGQHFAGLERSLRELRPEDLRRVREMVRDLNQMLGERLAGKEPDFEGFRRRYGDMFPPGIDSLDALVAHLQERGAQFRSLMESMSPAQRASLQQLVDALLRDDRLKWDLAQLGAHLDRFSSRIGNGKRYRFRGEESLTLDQALGVMERLQGLEQMERQLQRVHLGRADIDSVDAAKVRELLGDEAAEQLEQLRSLARALEDAGHLRAQDGTWQLTPRAMRRVGQKALRDIFATLRQDRAGKHATNRFGRGGDRADESKSYEFGDPFLLDLERTVMNAIQHGDPGVPVRLRPDDFAVYRSEQLTECATAIMLDMSRSMVLRDCFTAAKKVALALNFLIRTMYPKDHLYIVLFSEYARECKPEDLLGINIGDHEMGTNMHHGLMLCRQLLGRHKGSRQIILVTDGEPTAHLLPNGRAYFDYPPDPRTIRETLREVGRCTREQIVVNTFMLEQSPYLVEFIGKVAKVNRGRAFYASPQRLGEYILVDYVARKTKRVH